MSSSVPSVPYVPPPLTVKDPFQKGFLGVAATTTGEIVSRIDTLEAWLRITSLIVGIAVGVITFIAILRNLRNKRSASTDNHPKETP